MIKELWKYYSKYLKISRKESIFALILGIFATFSETFSIYFLANLISTLKKESSKVDIMNLENIYFSKEIQILIFLTFGILASFIYYFSNKSIVRAKCKVERYIREEITNITLDIKWEYYLKLSQGDISKSIISEGQNISEGYMYFLQSFSYFLIAITYFLICLVLVPDTFIVLLLYGFLAFRVYIYYSKKAMILGKDLSNITSNIGNWTASIFNNLKYIKTISKDKLARQESKKIFIDFSRSYSKAMIASYKSKFVTEVLTLLFIFLAIIYILITDSSTSSLILSLSLFIRMAPKVYNAQSRLLDSVAMISWPKVHDEKMRWAYSYKEKEIKKLDKPIDFNGNIIFNSVSFKYPDSESILDNLNLEIKRKESIGIIGKSGAGKSTFLDLLTGMIKPIKGYISISGESINNIDINKWRKELGIVMQETYFKNDTLGANIALGEKDIDESKIKESLKLANAWEIVQKLPNGINEIIYDRGMRFSGGERQKLALARSLYSNPKILILDEPTAGLDNNSQSEFNRTLKDLLGSMKIIVISHKMEVVKICDRVYVLENKRLNKI